MTPRQRALERFPFLLILSFVILLFPDDVLAHAPHDEVRAILLSPQYFYDGIVFAIVRYNILRSTNFGHTWYRLTQGLGPYLFLDLGISPAFATDQCLFAASQDRGVFRSDNAGLSWIAKNAGLPTRQIEFLVVSPTFHRDRRLMAGGEDGQLYMTDDAGDHWCHVFRDVSGVSAAAIIAQTLVVGTQARGIHISEDAGLTWNELAHLHSDQAITCFASLDHSSPWLTIFVGSGNGIFALMRTGAICEVRAVGLDGQYITSLASTLNADGTPILFASAWREAVFRSDDAGLSWTRHGIGLTMNRQADWPRFRRPQFKGLAISSAYAGDKTLFLGGFDGVFKSTDGGESWREMREALSIGLIVGMDLAPLDNNKLRVAITTYVAGIYSRESGGPWEVNNVGSEAGRFSDIAFSPHYASDQTVFALGNWALYRSIDGGQRWEGRPLVGSPLTRFGLKSHIYTILRRVVRVLANWCSGGFVFQLKQWWALGSKRIGVEIQGPGWGALLAISPGFRTDRTLFIGGVRGILRSRNGGSSVQHVFGTDGTPVRSLVISPDFPHDRTVFVAVEGCLYRSTDGGTTWEEWFKGQEISSARMAISPAYGQDRTLFLGSLMGLWRSRDGGKHWQRLPIGTFVGDTPIDGLALSPCFHVDHELVVHVCGGGLFRSLDGGDSFTHVALNNISPTPPLSHMTAFPDRASLIKFSPHYGTDRTLYASSMQDLLKSSDGGKTWEMLRHPVRFENLRPEISYRGKWKILRDKRFSSGAASSSSRPGDAVHMDFVGQEVRWIGKHGPKQGMAKVLIDNKLVATVDQHAATPIFSIVSFVASGLSHGPHSIYVEVSSDKNRQSSRTDITIDAFDVI